MLEKGFMLENRYEILEKIGAGGMAVVYKALCHHLDRKVAIKVLREEYTEDEDFVEKFRSEAIRASRLNHPNIVNIYDVGSENNNCYIVMEYVEGNTLKKLINSTKEVNMLRTMDIILKVCYAINSAHKAGIIHRDIKTQNIIITDENVVKVADFGIATATTSSTLSVTSNAIGSVHYFSPEQAKGDPIDVRSDIYSLGIVMFEMFTKNVPFEGESPVAVALKHVLEEVPQAKAFNNNISSDLDKIIFKATRRNPDDRYSNMTELISDLELEYSNMLQNKNEEKKEATDSGTKEEKSKSTWAVVNFERKKNKNINLKEVAATKETESEEDAVKEEVKEEAETIDKIEDTSVSIPDSPSEVVEDEIVEAELPQKIEEKQIEEEISEEELIALKALKSDYKDNDRLVYVSAILTSLVIISIISYFGFLFIQDFEKSSIVEVPNLVGKEFMVASKEVEDLGIDLEKVKEEFSEEHIKNTIIEQNFKTGEKIQKGKVINVIVSKGPEMLVVPNVIGQDFTGVKEQLSETGFNIEIETINDYNIPAGQIISQRPEADKEIKKSDKLILIVSLGKELSDAIVPNITGVQITAAKKTITDSNLKVGNIAYNSSDTVEKDLVISQSIKAGDKVKAGTALDLIVSTGKADVSSIFGANGNEQNTTNINDNNTQTNIPSNSTSNTSLKKIEIEVKPVVPIDKDKVAVMIVNISNSKLNLIYNKEHNKADFPFKYVFEGKVGDVVKVYIDGKVQIEDEIK